MTKQNILLVQNMVCCREKGRRKLSKKERNRNKNQKYVQNEVSLFMIHLSREGHSMIYNAHFSKTIIGGFISISPSPSLSDSPLSLPPSSSLFSLFLNILTETSKYTMKWTKQ